MNRFLTLSVGLLWSSVALAQDANLVEVATENGSFETLVAAVQAADLVETLSGDGPFTVFAPTDEAFAALEEGALEKLLMPENKDKLTAILTYHVVPGKVMAADVASGEVETVQGDTLELMVDEDGSVRVDDAMVTATDVMSSNGVIHVIDAVLMPEMAPPPPPPPPRDPTIVDIAAEHGGFGTLVAAIEAAGLVETLSGDGPFTVFAPTDEAFAALENGTVDSLLMPENKDKLIALLTYHVVAGKVMAADVVSGKVTTVEGTELKIKAKKGTVRVNKATVLTTDLMGSNGVIHVIDTVLMP